MIVLASLIVVGALLHHRAEIARLQRDVVRRYVAHRVLLNRLPFAVE
jgi:hypothetical protein